MATGVDETALNHATKHFEIHAAQRLTTFNFFIVISGAILAAIAASLQKPDEFALPGTALSLLLVALSFIFWKLDRRTKFLIKHSEVAIKKFEQDNLQPEFRVFTNEDNETDAHRAQNKFAWRMLSYSEAFGVLFIGSGFLGLLGAVTLTMWPNLLHDHKSRSVIPVQRSPAASTLTTTATPRTTARPEARQSRDTNKPQAKTSTGSDPAGVRPQNDS